ncbi:DUF1573 domain-containing protein [Candidatus Gottesmanbacteria bacterium]|nr:DUF1573 domain-containing protein [Candidatus Gottesmanbacteria bacterium]
MKTDKIVISIIVILVIVMIGGIVVVASKEGTANSSILSYLSSDSEKPKVETDSVFADLGNMKVSDEKSAAFKITNIGNKPLTLFSISSSCNCTVGKVTVNGVSSPELGMHSNSNYQATLNPTESATVEVIYRPSVMPVQGEVGREVYVKTNDPEKPMLTFSIKAYVE